MLLLNIFSLIGLAKFIERYNNDINYLVIISSIILIIFLSNLLFTDISIIYFTILIFGLFYFILFLSRKKFNILNIGKLHQVFLVVSIILSFVDYKLLIWDEFFWAQYTKSIFYEKKIYTANSILQNHPRYTPGIGIYQNYFTFYLKEFIDKNIIFANLLIILSFILIIVKENLNLVKRNLNIHYLKILLTIFFVITFFLIFNHGFLYLEFYIAIYISTCLILLSNKRIKASDLYTLIILASTTILIKESSLIFIILITILIFNKFYNFYKNKVYFILLLSIPYLLLYLWNIYVFSNGADINSFSILFAPYIKPFLSFFFSNLLYYFKTFFFLPLDYGTFTTLTRKIGFYDFGSGIWLVLSFLIFLYIKNASKNTILVKLIKYFFLFGLVYYPFCFFIDYSLYGEFSSVHFNRLSGIYIVSLLLLLNYLFLNSNYNYDNLIKFFFFIFTITAIIFVIFFNTIKISYNKFLTNKNILHSKINNVEKISKKINKITSAESKIYFIHQASSGFERTVFNYYVYPREVNSNGWSLGEKYNKIDFYFEDIWTANLNQEEIINNFKNDIPYNNKYRKDYCCKNNQKSYQFLFLNYTDENLWSKIGFLFEKKSFFLKYSYFELQYNQDRIIAKPIF